MSDGPWRSWEDFLQPGTTDVPRNRFGITGSMELSCVERVYSAMRLADLELSPLAGDFDLAHLQAIHRYMFQDVYDWPGSSARSPSSRAATSFAGLSSSSPTPPTSSAASTRTACSAAWTSRSSQPRPVTCSRTSTPCTRSAKAMGGPSERSCPSSPHRPGTGSSGRPGPRNPTSRPPARRTAETTPSCGCSLPMPSSLTHRQATSRSRRRGG